MRSKLWNYFEKCEDGNFIAICQSCAKPLSYRTSISNLRSHLKKRHPLVYNDLRKTTDSSTELSELLNNDESNHSTSTPDAWSFFEKETGGRARCVVCRASMPHRIKDLKMHLKDKHPKLAQDCDDATDNEEENTDAYTEVVYLEDETRKPTKKEQPKRITYKPSPIMKNKKRRKSLSSSEEREIQNDDNEDQIQKFSNYVACLLKQVPKDACMKLQMEIINLIMTTKLKLTTETNQNKMIIDGVPVAIQTVSAVPGAGFIVTVPTTVPTSTTQYKQTVSVPAEEVKGDPLNNEIRDLPKL